MITLSHQIKTLIDFWCRLELNSKSLIQPSEILPVKLTGTYGELSLCSPLEMKVYVD